ncbi:hypothetical protein CspeluHIS016_0803620 [Cutaneotrichosporon spelunceum]|uniref:DUF4240 domain-containing protein n=1 Tax=Cutaneotrichosporon spelunceum TaxID=1672016 RepID=A0AAD3TZH2_9TREE|nr:hypothetical protein CspeluHIS016_0803620 [Cutaneotrichosporon spelunceum]
MSNLTLDGFWDSITAAWSQVRGGTRATSAVCTKRSYLRPPAVMAINALLPDMLKALERSLRSYSEADLRAWDKYVHAAVDELGRPDVRAALGSPSDESFVFARAWVVGAGREYYALVEDSPSAYAVHYQWTEGILGVAQRVYEKRYGKWEDEYDT